MEVDERLDIARLDLHHQPDDARGQENLYDRRQGGDESLRPAVAAVGKHVQQVADADEQEDAGITFEHLGDDRRIEVRENLVEHQLHGFHRFGTEHQPSEADQIEGEENARNTPEPPHFGSCGFGAGNDAQPELVQGQRYAVQRSPEDEAHGRPVPQTAEQHGDEQVEIGADTPLAVLSKKPQPLFNYFKQLFAQVTNPPIDSIREEVVTSTTVYIGSAGNLLEEKPENCKVLRINNPILTNTDLMKIRNMKVDGFKVETIPIIYYKNTSLEKAVDRLFIEADRAYRDGANILILSDREVDDNHVAIPSLLAVSALQDFFSHILVKKLSLSISVVGDDAADTAIKYGKYCAVVYPAVGTIVRVVKCKGYGVDINPNFSKKAETEINFDFAARIFAFRLIGLAVKHGIKGIKLLAEVKND